MATFDSRMVGPQPHEHGQTYRASSAGTATAPISIPQLRAYPTQPTSNSPYSVGVRPQDGYLPEPVVPTAAYPPIGSYPGPLPQASPGYTSQNYQPQPPSSYVPPQQPMQYSYPPPNGVTYPPAPQEVVRPQPVPPPSSYPQRPRNDSMRSSRSGRNDVSPMRPPNPSGSYQNTWLPTTYEEGPARRDRRSSYDYAPYQTLSHDAPSRRHRRASYAHRRDYDADDRYERDYSSDSRSSGGRERRKYRSRKSRSHKDIDKQPTIGDSTLWAWDQIKGAIKGK